MTHSRVTTPFVRAYRRLVGRCVVCGRSSSRRWYDSVECGCYDGTMSVRVTPGRVLPKPSIWRGHTERYWVR